MDFGTWISNDPHRVAEEATFAEEHGFRHGWVWDLPLDSGELFVCLTLAAAATRTLTLGTWIASASYRIPAVTVSAIATIHAIAPGRVILGIGSGSVGRAVMGLPAIKFTKLRQHLTTVHDLLHEGEALSWIDGLQRTIRFAKHGRQLLKLQPRIPLYIAAAAPKITALAGALGDGVFNAGPVTPQAVSAFLQQVTAGARNIGRTLGHFPCVWETAVCILRPGETLESSRVIESTGHFVKLVLGVCAAGLFPEEIAPPEVRPLCQAYREHLTQRAALEIEPHLAFGEDHHFVRPEERRFITPEAIRWCTLTGTREELIDRIRALEEAGLTEIALSPSPNGVRDAMTEVSRELIGKV